MILQVTGGKLPSEQRWFCAASFLQTLLVFPRFPSSLYFLLQSSFHLCPGLPPSTHPISHFLPPPTHLLENGEAPDMVVHVLKLPVVDLVQQPHLPPRVGDPSPSSSQTCLKLLSSPPPDQESSAPRSPTSLTCCS